MFGSLVRLKSKVTSPRQSTLPIPPTAPDLSDRELILLAAAARASDGVIPADDAKGPQPHQADLDHLTGLGLIAPVAGSASDQNAFDTSVDRVGALRFQITPAGLELIGVKHEADDIVSAERLPTNDTRSGEGEGVGGAGQAVATPSDTVSVPNRPRASSRAKVDARETASVRAPRTPRAGDRLLKLLERQGGATIAELITETGWQAHSLRAALSRLRASGRQVMRQAEDGRTGAVYRLLEVTVMPSLDRDADGVA